jgi:hypothetical protein
MCYPRIGIADEFKTPFPVKDVNPIFNPDSIVPTFSGPLVG